MVRLRAEDGSRYTFAAFHARPVAVPGRRRAPAVCFSQTREGDRRIPGLGCAPARMIASELTRKGVFGGTFAGGGHPSGLQQLELASGLVPADARGVSLRRGAGRAVDAVLSEPFPLRLKGGERSGRVRAFLASVAYDTDGPEWLGPTVPEVVTVTLRDGSTKRRVLEEPQFFPMTGTVPPGRRRVVMELPDRPAPWRSVAYAGERGTLCASAAPRGERLIRATLLQCSSPLAVVNALERYGAALYLSNPNPRRERGPRSMAVFGYASAGARAVTIVNQDGRRFPAKLSRPWGTADRRPGDLAGLEGPLRERLGRLPSRVRLRSYVASIALPPEPADGQGLSLEVRLADGRLLGTEAP